MNFATVKDAGGKNVIMFGQIKEFKNEGRGSTGKPWKNVVVEDDEHNRETVTIRGNLPPADAKNKQAQFTLSTYDGISRQTGQPFVGYSGFCDIMPDYGQSDYGQPTTQQQAPQGPQQAQQQPQQRQGAQQRQVQQRRPQQAQRPQQAPMDDTGLHIVRQNTLNRAVEIYLHTANPEAWPVETPDVLEIVMLAERFKEYVYKGLDVMPASQQTFKQAVSDQAISDAVAREDDMPNPPTQTMGEAIKDAEAYAKKTQDQIDAERAAEESVPF